jgi:F-type H+-transporting ATPase subunit a
MNLTSPLETVVLFRLGPVPITETVATTWLIVAVLGLGAYLSSRRLKVHAGGWQAFVEVFVTLTGSQIKAVVRRDPAPLRPLLGTLFLFLVVANLTMLVPGLHPPTAQIETPAALAAIVFLSVHFFGVRMRGLAGHFKSYIRPTFIMLPLNILSEFTRTFSLMIRLFGNIMSHEFVIGIVAVLAGLLVPIPFMALGILIGLIQAYIFTVLATVFIGAAINAIETGKRETSSQNPE